MRTGHLAMSQIVVAVLPMPIGPHHSVAAVAGG